ncbi:MAG: hypothetical protein L3J82_07825, partial [Planctomycetes bacterium]|nr:hypothetical protein [Planctomycetota bacterium]
MPSVVYEYCNADGLASGAVARFEADTLDKSKQFRQYSFDAGGFQIGLNGQALPLYNLPAIAHEDEKLIVWVEGEKCVEALKTAGVLATTTPGGSGGFSAWLKKLPDALDVFAGREVVLMADNDKAGASYIADVGNALTAAGATVRVVDPLPWAGLGEK